MREDLMCFARILCLIAHYELGKDFYLETQLKNTYKFLIKMNDLHEVQKEIIRFLRNLNSIYPSDIKKEFIKMKERFIELEQNTYEKRAFLYLDIISWLESKIKQPIKNRERSPKNFSLFYSNSFLPLRISSKEQHFTNSSSPSINIGK